MNKLVCIFLTSFALSAVAQPGPDEYAEQITSEELKELVYTLSADSMEGRETGKTGQFKAAEFIVGYMLENDLKSFPEFDGFRQAVPLQTQFGYEFSVKTGKSQFNSSEQLFPLFSNSSVRKNKIKGRPVFKGAFSVEGLTANESEAEIAVFSFGDVEDLRLLKENLKKSAYEVVWMVPNQKNGYTDSFVFNFTNLKNRNNISFSNSTDGTDVLVVSDSVFKQAFDISITEVSNDNSPIEGDKVKMYIDRNVDEIKTENLVGFIPGTENPDEYVVVSAHYDHLGKKGEQIFNGADDNGSGTSIILEMLESFAMAAVNGSGPKRTIVFAFMTGEEKGLLGSKYFVKNSPVALSQIICNLNIDMVGRVDEKHTDNPGYIYVIGSDKISTELHDINETVNEECCNFVLDYTYNDENDPNRYYYRSDHYNFAEKGIPVIFYFSGVHDDYHKPTDTAEKLDYERMEGIARYIFRTTWEIANREKTLEPDKRKGL
jgi:hypothetical protein